MAVTRKQAGPPDSLDHLLVIMFQEPEIAPPNGFLHKIIHYLLYTQPSPVFAHVELLFPQSLVTKHGMRSPHFATYIGESARWWDADGFYKEKIGKFRAVPLLSHGIAVRAERIAQQSIGTSYSLLRYLFSGPLRWFARLVSDEIQSPAHCGILTARIIQQASTGILTRVPTSYSPSHLYLACESFVESTVLQSNDHLYDADIKDAIRTLVSGTDTEIELLTSADIELAIMAMATAVHESSHETKREAELDFASALLRISCLRYAESEQNGQPLRREQQDGQVVMV